MQRQVLGGSIMYPISMAREFLELYAEYSVEAPDDITLDFLMVQPPGGAPAWWV